MERNTPYYSRAGGHPGAARSMKIAFCFLTQSDLNRPRVWDAFFVGAASGECSRRTSIPS